jgi:hypothetical protein
MKLLVPGAGAAILALAACAPVGEAPAHASADDPTRCFTSADVDNFRVAGESQIYVHSRRGGAFRLDGAPNCFTASTTSISVEPYGGSSARMCPGDEVRVRVTNGSSIPLTCVARVTGPITDSAVSGFPG